jgi:cytoskeletal protein CcmA (bactofilin family)
MGLGRLRRDVREIVGREEGYVLPSVILLLTILTLAASSVIAVQYFVRHSTLIDIARIKAEYAAESGINKCLAQLSHSDNPSSRAQYQQTTYLMQDGGEAQVELFPWGAFLAVRSEGKCSSLKTTRVAIIADHPSTAFDNALILANASHQLLLAGTASIEGDVVVGRPGATVGNLKDYTSPVSLQIRGRIKKEEIPGLPAFDPPQLRQQLSLFHQLITIQESRLFPDSADVVRQSSQGKIAPSTLITGRTKQVLIDGDCAISDTMIRREQPLVIAVTGNVTIGRHARVRGLVSLVSSSHIVVEAGVSLDQAILCAKDSITLEEGVHLSGQLIAPFIRLRKGAVLTYPSLLLSTPLSLSDSSFQGIVLDADTKVEGSVILHASLVIPPDEPLIVLAPLATVIGAVYSNSRVSLDGTVIGTVMTRNFYFYMAPTTYLGWLRSGHINRAKLPEGFLVPPGLVEEPHCGVLDWL